MRTFVLALLIAATAPLLLSGCGETAVTAHHIQVAVEKCDANGGLRQVDQASSKAQTESCGYKCSRKTGKYEYEASFSCKNGAKFDLTWQE